MQHGCIIIVRALSCPRPHKEERPRAAAKGKARSRRKLQLRAGHLVSDGLSVSLARAESAEIKQPGTKTHAQ